MTLFCSVILLHPPIAFLFVFLDFLISILIWPSHSNPMLYFLLACICVQEKYSNSASARNRQKLHVLRDANAKRISSLGFNQGFYCTLLLYHQPSLCCRIRTVSLVWPLHSNHFHGLERQNNCSLSAYWIWI